MNLRPLLERLAPRLPPPRVIYSRDGQRPYLSRYYLAGRPLGDVLSVVVAKPRRVLVRLRHHGVYLHHFHRGDEEPELHSHPWAWALSLILAGGYREERRVRGKVVRRIVRPGALNFLRADDCHRVDLLEDDAWSLFVTGPKVTRWGFWNRDTGLMLGWREFIAKVRSDGGHHRPHTGMACDLEDCGGGTYLCKLCGASFGAVSRGEQP